jgi:hypothetical protein
MGGEFNHPSALGFSRSARVSDSSPSSRATRACKRSNSRGRPAGWRWTMI